MTVTARITQRLMVEHSLGSMQTALGRLSATQEQLTTGRVINRPSDSPTGTNTAMRLRDQLSSQDQYLRNAQDGVGWLGQIDTTISSVIVGVRVGRELVLQGSSTGSASPEAREALATQLTQIREELISQANTKYLGRPVFGGTTAQAVAYDADGVYVGNEGVVNRTVGDGTEIQVNSTGTQVFGADPDNLFAILDTAITNLRTNPSGLSTDLDKLDAAMSRLETSIADVGTRAARLDGAVQAAKDVTVNLQGSLSEVENIDLAKAMMDLKMQEVAYQAALGATARVIQPSLLDFLR